MQSALSSARPGTPGAHPATNRRYLSAAPRHAAAGSWPISLLGVPFDNVTLTESLDRIEAMIASGRPHYVVTANADFLVQSIEDVELHRILLEADMVLCDGTPLVWASRLLGNALKERVAGSDLVPRLIEAAARKQHRIFFLGGETGVAAQAVARVRERFPKLQGLSHYSPPFNRLLEMDHEEIAARVRAAKPDLLFVSFGCPKQEKWLAMHYRSLGVPVVIGVGATIDFLAGRVKRAPVWMQRSGTEWIFRLLQEPRRLFRRYAGDLVKIVPSLLSQTLNLGGRWNQSRLGSAPTTSVLESLLEIKPRGRLDRASLDRNHAFWTSALTLRRHCVLNLTEVPAIDSTGVAFLLQWHRKLLQSGYRLLLIAPGKELAASLDRLRLGRYLRILPEREQVPQFLNSLIGRNSDPVIRLNGASPALAWQHEVSAANSDLVWQLTLHHLETSTPVGHSVHIDLSSLRFIDSTGLGLMLRLKKWCAAGNRTLTFSNATADVRNVVRMVNLSHVLLEEFQ